MRILSLFCCAVVGAMAQNVTVLDNDQVKVLKVTQTPHNKTRLHDHKINRVMIYLQPGRQTIEYQDGKKTVIEWKAGEAKWSPASSMHIAEITSNNPVTIVEVELKKPGSGGKMTTSPMDPVKIHPRFYKVEMENDQVRVVRAKVGGKGNIPLHEHSLNRVVTYISDQDFRITSADGKVDLVKHSAGDVSWGGKAKHKEENLSSKPFEIVMVEIKN